MMNNSYLGYTGRFALWIVGIVAAAAAVATSNDKAALDVKEGKTTLTVESPRPLAKAVETLMQKYGSVITYEDPRYSYADDLEDDTERVRKDLDKYPSGKAPRVIGPVGGSLSVSSSSGEVGDILSQVIQASEHGHFQVVRTGDVLHVVPTEARDVNGNWMPQTSILDARISLPAQDRSAYETVSAICQAVGAAAHVHVGFVGIPLGGLQGENAAPPPTYRLEANGESARSVLMRAMAMIFPERKKTWLLLNGSPQDAEYGLNVMDVPGAPPLQILSPLSPSPHRPDTGGRAIDNPKSQ